MLQAVEFRNVLSEEQRKALNDFLIKKRKEIVYTVAENRMISHGGLAREINTTPASLSNILLKFDDFKYKLIDSKQEGKYRYYYITDLCRAYLDECTQNDINLEQDKIIQQDIGRLIQQVKMSLEEIKKNGEEEWEVELDDALIARLDCKRIEKNKKEQLIDQFIIGIEQLILYDYQKYSSMALKLLEQNSILREHFVRLLNKFDSFFSILQEWKNGDDTIEVYNQLESKVLECYRRHEQLKMNEDVVGENESELTRAMSHILEHLEFQNKRDINDCFMRFLAGNKALSGYLAQTVWNTYKERDEGCK